jgi:hypothetical protein
MRIIITEDQKKKLFIPRKLDGREDAVKGMIKEYLIGIKDYPIWDFISKIEVSYVHEFDDVNSVFYNKSGMPIMDYKRREFIESNLGPDKDYSYVHIDKMIRDIETYMFDMYPYSDDILQSWSEISFNNGKLEYKESRVIKIYNNDYRVVSI